MRSGLWKIVHGGECLSHGCQILKPMDWWIIIWNPHLCFFSYCFDLFLFFNHMSVRVLLGAEVNSSFFLSNFLLYVLSQSLNLEFTDSTDWLAIWPEHPPVSTFPGDWTYVLMLVQQALSYLSHLPIHFNIFHHVWNWTEVLRAC